LSMENRRRRPRMIPERTPPAQLPLPFQQSPIVQMTPDEKAVAVSVLAQLLLMAAGAELEETNDEH